MKRSLTYLIPIGLLLLSACNWRRPEQVNAYLYVEDPEHNPIDKTLRALADRTGKSLTHKDFQYSQASIMKAFEVSGGGVSVLVTSLSDQECNPTDNPPFIPRFREDMFAVDIVRTSAFGRREPLQEILGQLAREASRHGARVVTSREQFCSVAKRGQVI